MSMIISQRGKVAAVFCLLAISGLALTSTIVSSPPYWLFLALSALFILTWIIVAFETHVAFLGALLILFAATLRSLYLMPDPILIGYDAYNELLVLEEVMLDHVWVFNASTSYIGSYPVLYVYSTLLSEVFNWTPIATAKYSSWLYVTLPGFFIYLLCRNRVSRPTPSLLWLPFAVLYTHIFLHTNIHREALALAYILLLFFLYDRVRYETSNRIILYGLSYVVLVTLILTHHMTSAVAVFFLLVLSLTYCTASFFGSGTFNPYTLSATVGGMVLLWFWTTLEQSPLVLMSVFMESMTGAAPTEQTGEITTISAGSLRIQVLLWGEVIVGILLGGLGLGEVYFGRRDGIDVSFLAVAGVFGMLLVLAMVGIVFPAEGLGLATRFKILVYVAALPLAAYTIRAMLNHPWKAISVLAIILVASFAMLIKSRGKHQEGQALKVRSKTHPQPPLR